MKRLYCADIETDGLLEEMTKVWCASFTELDSNMGVVRSFTETTREGTELMFSDPDNILVIHNGLGFDGPAITKLFKTEVKAEIVDTLYLSWYLYPNRQKHGLAGHGEDLGIPKPVVDDWENLSLAQYVHRCEEDVKIQTKLWRQMFKHLRLIYDTDDQAWHCIRHLNFKASCAAAQYKSKWKLNREGCDRLAVSFRDRLEEATIALQAALPDVPKYKTSSRPKKPFLMNGEPSSLGLKWKELVMKEKPEVANPMAYNQPIRSVLRYDPPKASSHSQVKEWLFSLGWVPEVFKYVREEDNSIRKIPQVKNTETGTLCPDIERMISRVPELEHLREMSVIKHRLVVCDTFLNNVDELGFVRAQVQGFTNTLRFKHKVCLNIPSSRKPYGEALRSLLTARDDSFEICGSDMSSLEDRTKQHYMWPYDPEYVKEMQGEDFDPHLDMALAAGMVTFTEIQEFKRLKAIGPDSWTPEQYETVDRIGLIRHGGKSTNYAATYGAQGPTIARSAGVSEEVGTRLVNAWSERNWSLKAIADNCIVKQSRGMKWLWNPVAQMWFYLKAEKDKFSTLNQSTGAYCFDRWLFHVMESRYQLTAQFHDEGVWELKKGHREAMTKILKDAMINVNKELRLNRELDCDIAFAENYGGVH